MQAALDFCKEQKFQSVYLWTTRDLRAAARVYELFGFKLTEEKTHPLWGKMVTEIKYHLSL